MIAGRGDEPGRGVPVVYPPRPVTAAGEHPGAVLARAALVAMR